MDGTNDFKFTLSSESRGTVWIYIDGVVVTKLTQDNHHWTLTDGLAIIGTSQLILPGLTVESCKQRCILETSFLCKSIDYVSDTLPEDAPLIQPEGTEYTTGFEFTIKTTPGWGCGNHGDIQFEYFSPIVTLEACQKACIDHPECLFFMHIPVDSTRPSAGTCSIMGPGCTKKNYA